MLPIALERATRVVGILMHSFKEYVGIMELHGDVSKERIVEVMKMFVGKIYQRPPVRSSVKRALRVKEVYSLNVLEVNNREILFKVRCESGTYVRKLCHDIGLLLGVEAHMRELRRIAVAHLREDLFISTLHEVSEALYLWRKYNEDSILRNVVVPGEFAVAHLPKILIKDGAVDAVAHGAQLAVPGIAMLSKDITKGCRVAVMTLKGELVAIGKAVMDSDEISRSEKGIAVEIERVVMEPNLYPKMWKRKLPQ
ncbi:MAG: RNA-guided pseudouridylation complex pseudouridine synthase subunit Cbf5 [Ignisphaera sp.]|nr:RNA-guided pseudouridylation complex pseudouridine synthase subunit Cbf5 [Ignisphaera sp.]MCX8168509.1 RNA-guided pseudouridylation complex pseudouridine synthase subunit Cbf5 [Ignisphaera sp.]MDW8085051.1 RNA-guided pseudouridylation complex pseudouridine synthase subunit Cbf5 [Ignisphaera sp.]